MADVKVKVMKVKRTTIQVEKKIDDHKFVRISSAITDKSGLTSVVLEMILGSFSRNVKTTLPKGKQLLWLQALRDATSETLEELEKILPAE